MDRLLKDLYPRDPYPRDLYPQDHYPRVAPLFDGMSAGIALDGVLDGVHEGSVIVDDAESPQVAFVWTPWGYHYLAGEPGNEVFNRALHAHLIETLLPRSRALGEPAMLITVHPTSWVDVLDQILPDPPPIEIFRRRFRFDPQTFRTEHADWRGRVPAGYTVARIDAHLAPAVQDDIQPTWHSVDDFLDRGVGYALLKDGIPVSVCTSAFVSRGRVEIGVRTAEAYRRRGFARLTAAALIDHCLCAGLEPHWECFWDNTPSVKLAESLGFEPVTDTPIYYWEDRHES